MIRLDHLNIVVSDYRRSRDWLVSCLGLHVGFENLEAGVGGLQGDGEVELILTQGPLSHHKRDCMLTFQCDSVDAKFAELSARGVAFTHPPMKVIWGYGAELADPDGYPVRLWDKFTMPGYREK
jgi:catechol 2,3-dioxygenase-like lactoylglutathione lyase family enzyme